MEVVDELSVMTYVSMLYKRMTKQSRSGKCCVYTSHQIHIYMVSSLEAGDIFKRPGIRRHSKNGQANKVLLLVFSFSSYGCRMRRSYKYLREYDWKKTLHIREKEGSKR